jgi:hypothetical protein
LSLLLHYDLCRLSGSGHNCSTQTISGARKGHGSSTANYRRAHRVEDSCKQVFERNGDAQSQIDETGKVKDATFESWFDELRAPSLTAVKQ